VPAQGAFTARAGWEGVAATADARAPRDVRGQTLPVRFEVVDRRPPLVPPGGGNDTRGPYQVAVMLQARRRGLPARASIASQPTAHCAALCKLAASLQAHGPAAQVLHVYTKSVACMLNALTVLSPATSLSHAHPCACLTCS